MKQPLRRAIIAVVLANKAAHRLLCGTLACKPSICLAIWGFLLMNIRDVYDIFILR